MSVSFRFVKPVIAAEVYKRQLNKEPQKGQGEECGEWNCGARLLCPSKEIEEED